jgi:hypothetical protein
LRGAVAADFGGEGTGARERSKGKGRAQQLHLGFHDSILVLECLVMFGKFSNLFFPLDLLNNSGLSVRNYSAIAAPFSGGARIASSFALPLRTRNREETAQGFQKYSGSIH